MTRLEQNGHAERPQHRVPDRRVASNRRYAAHRRIERQPPDPAGTGSRARASNRHDSTFSPGRLLFPESPSAVPRRAPRRLRHRRGRVRIYRGARRRTLRRASCNRSVRHRRCWRLGLQHAGLRLTGHWHTGHRHTGHWHRGRNRDHGVIGQSQHHRRAVGRCRPGRRAALDAHLQPHWRYVFTCRDRMRPADETEGHLLPPASARHVPDDHGERARLPGVRHVLRQARPRDGHGRGLFPDSMD